MRVVVVIPFFTAVGRACLSAFAALDGIESLAVVTPAPAERIPAEHRGRVQHVQVRDLMDAGQLAAAVGSLVTHWGRVDRLVSYLEQLQVPLAIVRAHLDIPGTTEAVARNFRDKNRMKAVLGRAGLPVARQALLGSRDDAARFVARVGYPLVVKPTDGAGSRGTMRVGSDAELLAALEQHMVSPSRPAQAEEFVQGDEHSFETVVVRGEPVWHSSSYYLPGPLTVLENPWMQYCIVLPREQSHARAASFRPQNVASLRALGADTALTHMEWFRRADGSTVVNEVAMRPPGVQLMPLMSQAHQVDFWAKWAELLVHERWDVPERQFATGVAFLRGHGRGRRVTAVHGLDAAQEVAGSIVVDRKLPVVGQARADGYEGEGWAIVRAPTTAQVVAALRTLVTTIRIELG